MKNQYPTFSMDAVRGADLIQRHKAGLLILMPYQMKCNIWYFHQSEVLHLFDMADRWEKLSRSHCYLIFSDSRDIY